MLPQTFKYLTLALVLSACGEQDEGVLCPTDARAAPVITVVVRDAETSDTLCDAKVEARVDGGGDPVVLRAIEGADGACSYTGTAPSESAVLAVERAGYESTTKAFAPNPPDKCGDVAPAQITVDLTPQK